MFEKLVIPKTPWHSNAPEWTILGYQYASTQG